jgi:hypothetical protein
MLNNTALPATDDEYESDEESNESHIETLDNTFWCSTSIAPFAADMALSTRSYKDKVTKE